MDDDDDARRAFAGELEQLDDGTNRRLARKADLHLMPLLCIIYALNYLDKTTLSYASVMGLKQDIGLGKDSYQYLGSIFYLGYIVWEYPSSRMLQYFPLAKYSSINVILWGATLTCFAAVQSFQAAAVVRFFLGAFEAAVTPGFSLFTSQWYTKTEQGARTGIWFGFNGIAAIIGGVLAFGILKGTQQYGSTIAPWRILFLATGGFTVIVGFVFLYLMPDSQFNARFLNPSDRLLAIQRIRGNQQGIGNKHFKWHQLREAFTDPMTWAFTLYALAGNIPNGGITNFFSQIIVLSGFTPEQSLLYGAPAGAVQTIALVVSGILGDRYRQRIWISCIGLLIGILGAILLVVLPLSNGRGRLGAFYLTQASPTAFVALLSLISTNVAGHTKKTMVAATYMVGYCIGNFIGPQTFRDSDAPRYSPALIAICSCWAFCFLDLMFIRAYYKYQNKQKAVLRAASEYRKVAMSEFMDLTDTENPELIYTV